MYDIIIIGAGPAGMTAALYARRAKKKVLLIEALTYGGQIINTPKIENYPVEPHISGVDFAMKLYNQVVDLGAEFVFEKAYEIKDYKNYKEVKTNNNTYQGKTVIIATGASKRKLGLEKEDYYLGKGLSYCATCDGSFFKDKTVGIVGEDNALEDILYLSGLCKKVIVISKKTNQKSKEILKENIEILENTTVKKLIGEKKLEKIEIENEKDTKELELDGLFIAIGQAPANEVFKNTIKMDSNGYIEAGEDCHTNIENIFVAGDNRTKNLRQLVTATSDGANAATEAIKALQNIE